MEIEKAFKKLLIKHPFYGLFCMSLPKVVTKKIPTLQISKHGINCELQINPDFWALHTDEEQISLLMHELSHIALQHMFMSESFEDKRTFNIAADAEVNSHIQNLPKSAVTNKVLEEHFGIDVEEGMGTKAYYEMISEWQKRKRQEMEAQQSMQEYDEDQEEDSQSSSSPSLATSDEENEDYEEEDKEDTENPIESPQEPLNQDREEESPPCPQEEQEEAEEEESEYPDEMEDLDIDPLDSHDSWKDFENLPDAAKQLITHNIEQNLKQTAEQVEKMHGDIPGEFKGLIEQLRKKKPEIFNWKSYFRRMLGSIYDVNIKSTKRKESRRFEGAAGIQHRKKVSILVAVDTSGSVSDEELQEFFSEIYHVYKAGARVTILECDSEIQSITEYDGKKIPEISGRGGTSFDPPVDYYVEHRKEYAALIYFTDGECCLPKKRPQGMVWVITSNGYHQDYPGKVVYIPKKQKEE